ncbi:hypothetical protein HPC49_20005 [Pyxidicoccus fallax]|uniref:Uncharacterized protein n=1 Tax=Pyxidicoccus fallax TaxID=394095 RepID=A0A848LG24_9BACT|nr:AHH domain-containing protein [Pyxidicoccus fallax]NMO14688.1 hypothetical protein [Pyxidicoccus fallax]NPC80496.1 hypothetical protein [Pyxidicoccus fallax]
MDREAAGEWHGWDTQQLEDLHLVNGQAASNKGCLTPHRRKKKGHHCSYHWHAFMRAQGADAARYVWPSKSEVPEPQPRAEGKWDPENWILSANKRHVSYYPREAHHIVPFESLTTALCTATSGDKNKTDDNKLKELRGGLLKNGYNINDEHNMAYLPSHPDHAKALRLPYHKGRHGTYSDYVEKQLDVIFSGMQDAIDNHRDGTGDAPNYKQCAQRIKVLSRRLRKAILQAHLPEDRVNGTHDTLKALAARLKHTF